VLFRSKRAILIPDEGAVQKAGKEIKVIAGGRNWNASLKPVRFVDEQKLEMTNPVRAFIDAVSRSGGLSLRAGGKVFGPYPGRDFATLMPILNDCLDAARNGNLDPVEETWVAPGLENVWKTADLPKTYSYGDNDGRNWSSRLEISEFNQGKPKTLRLTVSSEGLSPQSVSMNVEDAADNGTFGVYQFDRGLPSFVITNYTMGAHCCVAAQAVSYDGEKLHDVDLGQYDGSQLSIRDVDGDGTAEIDSYDQRFYYTFDSYAGSLPAKQIFKIRAGKAEDVTTDPAYQPYLVKEVLTQINGCYSDGGPGLCAGVLGTAAKAGLYQSVVADVPFDRIDQAFEPSSLDCSAEDCGQAKHFKNFRELLEYRLGAWGYETASSLDKSGQDFFKQFSAFAKGYGTADQKSEASCELGPTTIALARNGRYATLSGYEYSCRLEKVTVLNKSALAFGFCSAEGESYTNWLMIERDGSRLYLGGFDSATLGAGREAEVYEACR
jgi:hypothetical protein